MFKTDRGASKGKKWKILIVIAIVALLAAGVVLGITYWPAKSSDLLGAFDEGLNNLSNTQTTQNGYIIQEFISNNLDQMKQNADEDKSEDDLKDGYSLEMEVFPNLSNATQSALFFYKSTIESSIKGNLKRGYVKAIKKNISEANKELGLMASHIKSYSTEDTKFTITLSIWEGVRDYYQSFLNNYVEAFKVLSEIYSSQTLSGVYGNDVTMLSVKAMYNYLQVIYENLFTKSETIDPKIALDASVKANKFSQIYGTYTPSGIKTINITSYFNSATCQKNIAYILKMEKETDGKVTFKYLIENNFSVEKLTLTNAMQKYIDPSVEFLKGNDLTQTDFVGNIEDNTTEIETPSEGEENSTENGEGE